MAQAAIHPPRAGPCGSLSFRCFRARSFELQAKRRKVLTVFLRSLRRKPRSTASTARPERIEQDENERMGVGKRDLVVAFGRFRYCQHNCAAVVCVCVCVVRIGGGVWTPLKSAAGPALSRRLNDKQSFVKWGTRSRPRSEQNIRAVGEYKRKSPPERVRVVFSTVPLSSKLFRFATVLSTSHYYRLNYK